MSTIEQQRAELQAELDRYANQVKNYHGETRAEIQSLQQAVATLSTRSGMSGGFAGPNPFAELESNASLAALREHRNREALIPLGVSLDAIRGAAVTNDGQSGSLVTQPTVIPGFVGAPGRPLMLLDLLPSVQVQVGSFKYNRLTSAFSYTADVQSEQGATKATQELPTEEVSASIATIAAISSISEQCLADAPVLQRQIGALLSYGAMRKLEMQIVAGSGVGENIEGLVTGGQAFASSSDLSAVDRVSECAASMQDAGWNPSAVIVNALDWHAARTSKAEGSGEYLSGSFDTPALASMWGLPVVTTPAVERGTAVVIDTAQLLVLDRQQPAVALGWENDDFSRNLLRVRGELRAGLAIFASHAVQVVTL